MSPDGFALLERLRPLLALQEQPVYLVGGAVRDRLLGREAYDLDFVLASGAIDLAFAVGDALHAAAYILDRERDIGRVVTGKRVVLDFARFRGPDLIADLRARDFTINAMAVAINDGDGPSWTEPGAIVDPCGGAADLQRGRLRLTHQGAIDDDPLRALRAVRLAWQLGLMMDPQTAAAAERAAPRLREMSAERVRDELLKLLHGPAPHHALRQLDELGLLDVTIPEVAALRHVAQSAPHHERALAHTSSVLMRLVQLEQVIAGQQDAAPGETGKLLQPYAEALAAHLERAVDGLVNGQLALRLGALLHDVGKAQTATAEDDGRIRFIGHDKVGATLAEERLRAMRLSNEVVALIRTIVAAHMRPLHLLQSTSEHGRLTRRAVYRYFRDTGKAGLDVALLSLADHLATYGGTGPPERWNLFLSVQEQLLGHYFERYTETVAPPLLVDGTDLMTALSIEEGPQIGRLLRLIEEAQAAGEIQTREEALALARRESATL